MNGLTRKQTKSQSEESASVSGLEPRCSEYKAEMLLTSTFGPKLFNLGSDKNLDDTVTQIHKVLSRVSVTKTLVWIGESVYWIVTSRNYN
jgi:hypothetical protein